MDTFGKEIYIVSCAPRSRVPRYKPGQFLHLTLDPFDPSSGYWPDSRVFSIASTLSDEHIQFIFSVKGAYTSRMARELHPGGDVWLKLPYGDFCIPTRVKRNCDIVLVAGGTGISPFIPFLRGLSDAPLYNEIHLFYGVRHSGLLLEQNLLAGCLNTIPNFKIDLFIEQNGPPPLFGLPFQKGRLSWRRIHEYTRNVQSTQFFLSGPPEMLRVFQAGLISADIPAAHIIIDAWE